jgi:hypothetical protein
MTEADLSQLEERLMSESNLYEELLILEDELVDQYLRGQMTDVDRVSFERYFLNSPEHREKVRFAQALHRYVDRAASDVSVIETEAAPAAADAESETKSRVHAPVKSRRFSFWPFQNPVLNYALASLFIIAIGAVSWMAIRTLRPTGPGNVFEATLIPGGVTREGGGEIQTITIPAGTDTVRLQLLLPVNQLSEYKAELIDGNGDSVMTRSQLTATESAGKKTLVVDIPARSLRRDTYRLKLSGRSAGAYEDIASYNFRTSN